MKKAYKWIANKIENGSGLEQAIIFAIAVLIWALSIGAALEIALAGII